MRQRLSWIALMLIIIIIGYYAILIFRKPSFEIIKDSYSYTLPSENDSLFGNLFKSEIFNDSLPHYQYLKFKDSLDRVRINEQGMESKMLFSDFVGYAVKDFKTTNNVKTDLKNHPTYRIINDSLKNIYSDSNYLKNPSLYTARIQQLQSIQKRIEAEQHKLHRARAGSITYFVLNNYKFKDSEIRYFEKEGKNYLALPVVDGEIKNSNGGTTTTVHYERREIPFEYNEKEHSIYFSVASGWSTLMIGIFWTIVLLSVAVFLYIFIRLPIGILSNISSGYAFDFQNIRDLRTIFKWLVGIAIAKTLLPIILYSVFSKYLHAYFEPLSWFSIFSNLFGIYLSCLVVHLIRKAFEEGHELQKNEDLTV